MDLERLADEIKPAMIMAAESVMNIYDDYASFEVTEKQDSSPLTKADLCSNEILCDKLNELTPDILIVSEENKEIEYSVRKDKKYIWLVDPLDGTKEFVKRNGEFTINIALLENGIPILGLVQLPTEGKLYVGIKSKGAYLDAERLHVGAFSMSDKNVRIVASRSHISEDTKRYVNKFDNPTIISKGSSLKFTTIAEGSADFYPRLAPTMEWDTAAAQIILEEAGGYVLDINTLRPLKYNKQNLTNPYFLAFGSLKDNLDALTA